MKIVFFLDKFDERGVEVSSPAFRLHKLNHGFAQIEADDEVAIRDVDTFLGNGCCKQAIEIAFPKLLHGYDLHAKGIFHFSKRVSHSSQETDFEVGTTDGFEYELQKASVSSSLNEDDTAIIGRPFIVCA